MRKDEFFAEPDTSLDIILQVLMRLISPKLRTLARFCRSTKIEIRHCELFEAESEFAAALAGFSAERRGISSG